MQNHRLGMGRWSHSHPLQSNSLLLFKTGVTLPKVPPPIYPSLRDQKPYSFMSLEPYSFDHLHHIQASLLRSLSIASMSISLIMKAILLFQGVGNKE